MTRPFRRTSKPWPCRGKLKNKFEVGSKVKSNQVGTYINLPPLLCHGEAHQSIRNCGLSSIRSSVSFETAAGPASTSVMSAAPYATSEKTIGMVCRSKGYLRKSNFWYT